MRWSEVGPYGRPPPTCVLLHGILGSRRNLTSFAHRVVEARPPHLACLLAKLRVPACRGATVACRGGLLCCCCHCRPAV